MEAEKYHDSLFLWVCAPVRGREGKTKKLANIVALPGGGDMPLCWLIDLFPCTERNPSREGGGRVHHYCEGGEVGGTCFTGVRSYG